MAMSMLRRTTCKDPPCKGPLGGEEGSESSTSRVSHARCSFNPHTDQMRMKLRKCPFASRDVCSAQLSYREEIANEI